MTDNGPKYRKERDIMYAKCKKMLGEDGPKFVSWLRAFYDERRKNELYDEIDDEDEDELVMAGRSAGWPGGSLAGVHKQGFWKQGFSRDLNNV